MVAFCLLAATTPEELAKGLLAGDRRALARALTAVEGGGADAEAVLLGIYKHVGGAWRLGFTGPPGAGKSTLVSAVVRRLREREGAAPVSILAVDPTSPFTGGALLGDRVRMTALQGDAGVFIRSMATRGAFGGLARAASDAVDLLDAAGADPVVVETVGVGQSEVEIAGVADTTVVVLSPESGDGVQALKAGILEVADCFAINKADRDGADRIARDIEEMLHLASGRLDDEGGEPWVPPVVMTVAIEGGGVDGLIAALQQHRDHLRGSQGLRRRRVAALRLKVRELVEDRVRADLWTAGRDAELGRRAEAIHDRADTPYAAARDLLVSYRQGASS